MTPTRDECIADAGAVYGAILADPVRGPEIRAARAADETRPRRFSQCDATCTTDCGHCKGRRITEKQSA